jgi:hypothetical protein
MFRRMMMENCSFQELMVGKEAMKKFSGNTVKGKEVMRKL